MPYVEKQRAAELREDPTRVSTTGELNYLVSRLLALYVAVADLIPSLHRRSEPMETAKQALAIGLGLGVIASVHGVLSR